MMKITIRVASVTAAISRLSSCRWKNRHVIRYPRKREMKKMFNPSRGNIKYFRFFRLSDGMFPSKRTQKATYIEIEIRKMSAARKNTLRLSLVVLRAVPTTPLTFGDILPPLKNSIRV